MVVPFEWGLGRDRSPVARTGLFDEWNVAPPSQSSQGQNPRGRQTTTPSDKTATRLPCGTLSHRPGGHGPATWPQAPRAVIGTASRSRTRDASRTSPLRSGRPVLLFGHAECRPGAGPSHAHVDHQLGRGRWRSRGAEAVAFGALGTEPTREVVGGGHDSLEEALGSRPVVLDDREVGATRTSVMPYAQACEPTFAY